MSDDPIEGYLDHLLGESEPGAMLHHLLVASAEEGPLGAVDTGKLEVTLYALAPDETVDTDEFIGKAILSAIREAQRGKRAIYFAGLAIEAFAVDFSSPQALQEGRRLRAAGKLNEHPDAVECTRLYAACRDGRRWVGKHYLTGRRAGTKIGPLMRLGTLSDDEQGKIQHLLRLAVGR